MTDKRKRRALTERAFTLVEIMVVIVILGLLMTFVMGRVFGAGDQAKAKMTKLKMQSLKQKVNEFKLMYNTLPNSLDDLSGCTEVTGPGCIPLLEAEQGSDVPDALLDAWGEQFQYQKKGNNRSYALTSLGADGAVGGEGVNYDFSIDGP